MSPEEVLTYTEHRPFPVPEGEWVGRMRWHDLLFMHWRVPSASLRPLVPHAVPIDVFDGSAWVGIVPFYMSHMRTRWTPPVPGLSAMPELNLRTYATVGERPGVYFFSLDIPSVAAVLGARFFYALRYYLADIQIRSEHRGHATHVAYGSRRRHQPKPAEFRARYWSTSSEVRRSEKDSLEYFLTERYCLYSTDRTGERLYRANIHHPPWPLQAAECEVELNTLARAHGIPLPADRPLLHFAKCLDVLVWPLERVHGRVARATAGQVGTTTPNRG